jgi:hypothetical protein
VSGGRLEGDLLAGEAFQFGDELPPAAQRGDKIVPVRACVFAGGYSVNARINAKLGVAP